MINKVFNLNLVKRITYLSPPFRESFSTFRPLDLKLTSAKDESKGTPVVLLLGWLGCQDKHLKKYSKIYEDRGMTTLRYTVPGDALFVWRPKMTRISKSILRTLEEENLTKNPLIVHVFSNGGAYAFKYISDEMKNSQLELDIRGQIFDSAPCGAGALGNFYHVLKEIIGKDKIYSSLVASSLIFGVICIQILKYPFQAYLADKNPYEGLLQDQRNFPQLFLYSKEDKLMPFEDVEKFIKARKKLGIDVTSNCFNGSPHVSHYLMFKDAYLTLIDDFLKKCLNKK
ncbi:transmembrane protein 53-A-like [Culicoides brevitarsis]|uniref:transmembrane protein 53-A-like n=1 Tax=Culicoides brevitarsis TaxID=469753 RepID=UPI00307C231F